MKYSQITQFILAAIFGPLGLFYSSTAAGIVCSIIGFIAYEFLLYGLILLWIGCLITGYMVVDRNNKLIDIKQGKNKELLAEIKLLGRKVNRLAESQEKQPNNL